MNNSRLVKVSSLALAVACRSNDRQQHSAQATTRQITPMSAETLWVRGGRKADHVLKYPEYLAHDSAQVYVTDMGSRQVSAIDQRTGATNWTTSDTPGTLRAPGSIAGLPGGGVAVLDAAGALVRLDSRGRVISSASLIDGTNARQVCALNDSTFLIAYLRQRLPLVVLNAAGKTLRRLELPWEELRELTPLQTQVILAGGASGRCIASLAFGHGIAAIRTDGTEWTASYVERVDIPRVNAKTIATTNGGRTDSHIGATHVAVRDVTVDANTIEVVFEGNQRAEGSLIDEYDLHTGQYRMTRSAGRRVMGIQKSGDRAFLLVGLGGYPALVAMSMRDQLK